MIAKVLSAAMSLDTCNLASHHTTPHQQHEERYHLLNVINRGSYGVVYRALDRHAGDIVAIKHELDGLTQSTLREISILASLPPHPSIVELREVKVDERDRVLVVMEFLPSDLGRLIDARRAVAPFTEWQVKVMMRQIVEGVAFLHGNGVMHRDLKPANILINERDRLKICDFGLSRRVRARGSYTPGVVTQWYRAPEVLLGHENYTCAIDMWSVGCIMAELLLRKVVFPGDSEIQQLGCIYFAVGARLRMTLQAVAAMGEAPQLSSAGFDLLERFLELDPNKRITAKDALKHPWFAEF